MRAAVKDKDGLVVNVIEYDTSATYRPPTGLTVVTLPDSSPVGTGWRLTKDGPVAPTPAVVTADPAVALLATEKDRVTTRTGSEQDALLNLLAKTVLAVVSK